MPSSSAIENPSRQIKIGGTLGIYRWDPVSGEWRVLESELDIEHQALNTTTDRLGAYALLGPPVEGPSPCEECRFFLPVYEAQ